MRPPDATGDGSTGCDAVHEPFMCVQLAVHTAFIIARVDWNALAGVEMIPLMHVLSTASAIIPARAVLEGASVTAAAGLLGVGLRRRPPARGRAGRSGSAATSAPSTAPLAQSAGAAASAGDAWREAVARPAGEWPGATASDGDLVRAGAFLDCACALPQESWLSVGELELAVASAVRPRRSGALAVLDAVLLERRLTVPAWYARDAVDTVILHGIVAPTRAGGRRTTRTSWSAEERRRFDAARQAAEGAMLALLVRRWLPEQDFDELYAPFAGRIPLDALDDAR
jgi:hypothetical protein